jgi:hypothetical protein
MSSVGKSGNRVCFAALGKMSQQLRVWTLTESGDETEWLLKHHTVVSHPNYEHIRCADEPWATDAANDVFSWPQQPSSPSYPRQLPRVQTYHVDSNLDAILLDTEPWCRSNATPLLNNKSLHSSRR